MAEQSCIFCRIVAGKAPASVVFELLQLKQRWGVSIQMLIVRAEGA